MKNDDQVVMGDDKSNPIDSSEKDGVVRSSTYDGAVGDVETVEMTKRGLKARHAQMIALGGTIGKISREMCICERERNDSNLVHRHWSFRRKWKHTR